MNDTLDAQELQSLMRSVFSLTVADKHLLFIVDVPDEVLPDTDLWRTRRALAEDWCNTLNSVKNELGLETVQLVVYPNVHSNNADLPEYGVMVENGLADLNTEGLFLLGKKVDIKQALEGVQIVIALTQLSTTAPLKVLSRQLCFRAATMPGFCPDMIPALRLDYQEVNRRVSLIAEKVTLAESMDIHFTVDKAQSYSVHFDLRHRQGHSSGGRFPVAGVAGNLPSGECYIVPYEGELAEESLSDGILPVQLGDEVVIYRIEKNKAVEVLSTGERAKEEAERIIAEPAYANIAELGFGVLKDFGLHPIGVVLLDEKLGLHIAFGRSDHFGGAVGVKDFSSSKAVIHIDRIYIPETAPRINIDMVNLTYPDLSEEQLMKDGNYCLF